MEHREIKTPEQIAELKIKSPGGYRNLREEVIHNLPTPTVSDSKGAAKSEVAEGNPHGRLKVEVELLPTIVASEGLKATTAQGSDQKGKTGQVWLTNIAYDLATENGLKTPLGLLGTPRTSSKNGSTSKQVALGATKGRLEDQIEGARQGTIAWGKFEPAIRRWEAILGRQSPSPTNPDGKDGSHRLAPEFTEFMMGLPSGWVCDAGLSRNDALKACGNGVVPQQALMALTFLLGGILPERERERERERIVMLPTPTVSDIFTGSLKSTQQKPGSMHSVTLPQAVRMINEEE
jgi:site-specific DNA-cytosine methylase